MIATLPFPTPHAAVEFFNAPANSALRLINVLPPDGTPDYLALYEDKADASVDAEALEAERLRLLDERIEALYQAPARRKRSMNFPESIIGKPYVPLSIVANRLGQLAAFRGTTTAERTEWVRDYLEDLGYQRVGAEEARGTCGCAAELVRMPEE